MPGSCRPLVAALWCLCADGKRSGYRKAAPVAVARAPPSPFGDVGCNATQLPRWGREAASLGGVPFRPPVHPPRPPPCPDGTVPDVIKSYSQYQQDIVAIERYFWGVTGGTFIEIGALDGVQMSNTKALEDHLGWTGLLVEAVESMHAMATVSRPRASVARAACGRRADPAGVTLIVAKGGSMTRMAGLPGGGGQSQRAPLVTFGALTERWGQ
eukprot:gene19348-36243_t